MHKGEVSRLESAIARDLDVLAANKEDRRVEVLEVRDYDSLTVRYLSPPSTNGYGGEQAVLDERPMTERERQVEMKPVLVGNVCKEEEAQEHA